MAHHSNRAAKLLTSLALASAVALVASGCTPVGSTDTSTASTAPIKIGATIPLSGALAGFGSFLKWGYNHAVQEVNAKGGITINGVKRKVQLTLVDDKSDPAEVTSSTRTLISNTNVNALLGSCTPDLVDPGAVVADSQGVPFVSGCAPVEVFKAVKKWTWAWDIFFSVPALAAGPFETLKDNKVTTNKKVFILHDNGSDGQAVGKTIWPSLAKANGYSVVGNVEFPADSTDFSAAVQKAKDSGADIVLIDSITPAALSIRKQMSAIGWTPKVIDSEKGGEPVQYAQALGKLANGVLVGAYWDPSFGYPNAANLKTDFEKETGLTSSQHIADSYSAAMVLMDAIAKANSTDPKKINTAIAATDKTYAVGPIKFDSGHAATIPVVESQWQDGKVVIVWPLSKATGKLLFPIQ